MNNDIEHARVPGDADDRYPTLFPLSEVTEPSMSPAAVCDRIGMNWMTALSLYAQGWLSFDPKLADRMTQSQKAELVFVGSLVAAGCDEPTLRRLLRGLKKPYAYRVGRVYYDWEHQCWRLLGEFGGLDEGFDDWVEELVAWKDAERLDRLRKSLERAIFYMQGVRGAPGGRSTRSQDEVL
jgi:hypothetical protein